MARLQPPPLQSEQGTIAWTRWYEAVNRELSLLDTIDWGDIDDFTGSDITDIANRPHNDLQSLQGGTTNQYYHLTLTQQLKCTAGLPFELPSYDVASVPNATLYEGHIIYVTDGDAGSKCIAVSDGTNWLRISLGSAISAT